MFTVWASQDIWGSLSRKSWPGPPVWRLVHSTRYEKKGVLRGVLLFLLCHIWSQESGSQKYPTCWSSTVNSDLVAWPGLGWPRLFTLRFLATEKSGVELASNDLSLGFDHQHPGFGFHARFSSVPLRQGFWVNGVLSLQIKYIQIQWGQVNHRLAFKQSSESEGTSESLHWIYM